METDKWLEQGIALVVEYAPKIVMAILIWIIGSIIFIDLSSFNVESYDIR